MLILNSFKRCRVASEGRFFDPGSRLQFHIVPSAGANFPPYFLSPWSDPIPISLSCISEPFREQPGFLPTWNQALGQLAEIGVIALLLFFLLAFLPFQEKSLFPVKTSKAAMWTDYSIAVSLFADILVEFDK